MKLSDVLLDMDFELIQGEVNFDINGLQYDSRKIEPKDVFFAVTGFSVDGHNFVDKAIEKGAVAVIV